MTSRDEYNHLIILCLLTKTSVLSIYYQFNQLHINGVQIADYLVNNHTLSM